jgi:Uma2 family endonuclease
MVTIPYELRLPTAADLPDADDTPVDNELQNDIPNILLNLLRGIWGDRTDWFFGVDMCIYYEPNIEEPKKSKSIVPDGFLALGVKPRPDRGGRLSYVLWEEKVPPILVLEVVSNKYGSEYEDKLEQYQNLGILYYVIYNPLSGRGGRHKNRQSLEVYKLIDGKYELLESVSLIHEDGKMVWMPEILLGIGCESGIRGNWEREWVYWYDRNCVRYPTDDERVELERLGKQQAEAIALQEYQARQQAELVLLQERLIADRERLEKEQEKQQKEKLAAYLRSLGINPDDI